MNKCKLVLMLLAAALVIGGCLLSIPTVQAADKSTLDSEEISKLLADAKTEAIQLKKDAEELQSFTRSKVSWQGHASAIEAIRAHVNSVGRMTAKLNDARGTASAWQEQAIDRITPLLKELAANTSATIECLNRNKAHLWNEEYKDFVTANYEMSSELASLIGDFVDYGKAKSKFERLRNKLEVDQT